jgi:hypothetical protein
MYITKNISIKVHKYVQKVIYILATYYVGTNIKREKYKKVSKTAAYALLWGKNECELLTENKTCLGAIS